MRKLGIKVRGLRKDELPGIEKAVKKLGKMAKMTVVFRCDNPDCRYGLPVPIEIVEDIKYCPKCGVKDGTFPHPKTTFEVDKK